MYIVNDNKIDSDIFPLTKGQEIQSVHFKAMRERMWLVEHPYADKIDTTIEYGKWVGDETNFEYVDYDINNWAGWNPGTIYHPGWPIVKYRWGLGVDEVDIFVFKGTGNGDIVSANPPVVGGKLNGLWLLSVDPNKYSHWNFNAGRPDIDADNRWIISQHGWDDPAFGGEGWLYGLWKAYQELPTDTDPYEQIPYVKESSVIRARHKPVEYKRNHISTKLQTQTRRMFNNGYVGIVPNHTWWYDHFFPDTVSEYIRLNGDPIDSIQRGPDYREPKKNLSFQDRIQHWFEQNYNYIVPVDAFWILNWKYWTFYGLNMDQDHDEGCVNPMYNYANGRGAWQPYGPPLYSTYDAGESVLHNEWFWCCIQDTPYSSIEPGVHADWEDYWVKDILYQPDFVSTTPLYVQYSDYLHCCNSSAFEKGLKDIGHYDWYWDEKYPAVPWFMYQGHYYWRTMEQADPGVGHIQTAFKRWPPPRGCWRRVWRHIMQWNNDRDASGQYRNQRSRFGKEIDIDGKMVSMFWPGEMGNPPGYDEQLTYWGYAYNIHYNFWWYRHIITQQYYNQIEQPVGEEWKYNQHYVVVDVEELFRQAYRSNSSVESRIAERHDPQTTDWIEVLNEQTGLMEPEEVPNFELHHDLVNDMRDMVSLLKYLRNPKSKTVKHKVEYTHKQNYPSGIAAYQAGKQLELYEEFGTTQHTVGYMGFACWYSNPRYNYSPWDETLPGQSCWRNNSEVTLISDKQDIPGNIVGAAMIRVQYRKWGVRSLFHVQEGCRVGFKDIILEDNRPYPGPVPDPLTWKAAYIGLESSDFKWEYNEVSEEWEYRCSFQTRLIDDWPPEAYFGGTYTYAEWRIWQRMLELKWDIDNDCVFLIDFDGYSDDVFAQDKTNIIEV